MIIRAHRSASSPPRCQDLEEAFARHDGQVMEVFLDDPAVMARWREPWISAALAECLDTGHAAEVEEGEAKWTT